MEYRHSTDYLRMRERAPLKIIFLLSAVMAALCILMFAYLSPAPDAADALGSLGGALLIVMAIGALQVRGARRMIAELPTVRFEPTVDGIALSSSAGRRLVKYGAIQEIEALRPWRGPDPVSARFSTTEGAFRVTGLDDLASFLKEVRHHAPGAIYREKRSLLA